MKKKTLLVMLAGIVLAVAVGGTVAYFTKEFSSEDNVAQAATFDVDVANSEGETIGDADFDLDEELVPGMEPKEVYQFQIDRGDTEVPVEYEVSLTPHGDLFPEEADSPVRLALQKQEGDEWVDIDLNSSFALENDTESFRVVVDWPHSDNDIDFQGKTGDVNLNVVATQVDEPEAFYSGEISFLPLHHITQYTTTNKEIEFYHDEDGYRVFEVLMGDGEGEFEEEVGHVRVFEYEGTYNQEPMHYYQVRTEHEHFSKEGRTWRVREDQLDTSVEGVIRLEKLTGAHFSIESDELYDWFTSGE
uniref:hypothetical protein n=1 Tax=uncultured Allobacillus sp. TaxID=1638025 RepID=UPI0025979D68|nr:hypothetical protein [uncultured Allobacillus sp.]